MAILAKEENGVTLEALACLEILDWLVQQVHLEIQDYLVQKETRVYRVRRATQVRLG